MNELQTTPVSAPAMHRSQESIFDNFETFNQAYKMAEILSKTQLIPQNFYNKPADCLIALDFARRLGMAPTAVLPELYVIHGRPATSAKFMISLVNRSGAFSRIQWREEVDGEVEYVVNGSRRRVPNYSAVAYFTESSTETEYKSPKIDVKFALANGWLTKNDSQWQKAPQLMCRYRSASILIKTVCPELGMGMESLEDVKDDADEDERPVRRSAVPRRVEVKQIENEDEPDEIGEKLDAAALFEDFLKAIEQADGEALREIGRAIADSPLFEEQKIQLRDAFKRRKVELAKAAIQPEQAPEQPEEPKPKRASRKKAAAVKEEPSEETKSEETKEDSAVQRSQWSHLQWINELDKAITKSNDFETLEAARDDVNNAFTSGKITQEDYLAFREDCDYREKEVREIQKTRYSEQIAEARRKIDAADAPKDKKEWAFNLVESIFEAKDANFVVKNLIPTANDWLSRGDLTEELYNAIMSAALVRQEDKQCR